MVVFALANEDMKVVNEPDITHHRYDMASCGRLAVEQRKKLLRWLSATMSYPRPDWKPAQLQRRPRMLGARATYHTVDSVWMPRDDKFKQKGRREGNFPKDPETNASLVVEQRLQPGLENEAKQLLRDFADGARLLELIRAAAAVVPEGDTKLRESTAAAVEVLPTLLKTSDVAEREENWKRIDVAKVWKRLRLPVPTATERAQLARALPYRAEREPFICSVPPVCMAAQAVARPHDT